MRTVFEDLEILVSFGVLIGWLVGVLLEYDKSYWIYALSLSLLFCFIGIDFPSIGSFFLYINTGNIFGIMYHAILYF